MCILNPYQSAYDKAFDEFKFVYHFTGYDAACKILFGNAIKLSNPNKTNDKREKRTSALISGKDDEETDECAKALEYILRCVRYLCVSRDMKPTAPSPYDKTDDRYLTDKTFRGFAIEAMWAHYADNHKGVCFIINEKKLRALIEKSVKVKLVKARRVDYKDRVNPYELLYDCIKDYCDADSEYKGIRAMAAYTFFKNNIKYLISKFFTKAMSWRDEREFRYVVVTDSPDPCYITGVADCIEGLVVGEDMEKDKVNALKLLVKEMHEKHMTKEIIPIRRISFEDDGTYLSEV